MAERAKAGAAATGRPAGGARDGAAGPPPAEPPPRWSCATQAEQQAAGGWCLLPLADLSRLAERSLLDFEAEASSDDEYLIAAAGGQAALLASDPRGDVLAYVDGAPPTALAALAVLPTAAPHLLPPLSAAASAVRSCWWRRAISCPARGGGRARIGRAAAAVAARLTRSPPHPPLLFPHSVRAVATRRPGRHFRAAEQARAAGGERRG